MNTKIFDIGTHKFNVVDKASKGYILWPIGRHNFQFPGYIPCAKPNGDFSIDPNYLEAVYVGNEEFCLWLLKHAVKGTYRIIYPEKDLEFLRKKFEESKVA